MNKPKVLIVVTDRRTLQEFNYPNVQAFNLEYHDFKILEFIVTDKDGARHHFPKEHYDYSIYQEQIIPIDSFDFNEIRKEYTKTIERLLGEDK